MGNNTTTRATLTALTLLGATAAFGCAGPKRGYEAALPPPAEPHAHQPAAGHDAALTGGREESELSPPSPSPAADGAPAQPHKTSDPFDVTPEARPGLATSWGETLTSKVSSAPFARATGGEPFALASVFYNDPQGIAAMTDSHPGARPALGRFPVGTGHVEMGVRDGGGHFLTGFKMSGKNYVTGVAGRRYTIVIKNHSPGRIEAVVSVDGLDVVDGKPGSLAKRGYLVAPFGDLEIDGFRTSTSEVAAFRFGSVKDSYANKKHGDSRNVGVIGVALFHEKGDDPRLWGTPRTHEDVMKRHDANPFPQK